MRQSASLRSDLRSSRCTATSRISNDASLNGQGRPSLQSAVSLVEFGYEEHALARTQRLRPSGQALIGPVAREDAADGSVGKDVVERGVDRRRERIVGLAHTDRDL